MTAGLEVALVERLTAGFVRAPCQLNAPHESDAELVRLPDGSVLAVTTDGIVEEIETGLYADPELAGWMAVTVNASDLAAVGADPLGILVCETLPRGAPAGFVDRLQAGIRAAAREHRLPLLGGDTNHSDRLSLTATALGLVRDGLPLTRCGAAAGDRLFVSGKPGTGAAFAFAQMAVQGGVPFRPRARLAQGALLRGYASACMDTSDGVLPTLHELGRLNQVGFELELPLEEVLHPAALAAAAAARLPPWTLLAGPHGEFELLFTVPSARVASFLAAARRLDWSPVELGAVTAPGPVRLAQRDGPRELDAGHVRDLFDQCEGDAGRYVAALVALDMNATVESRL